MLIGITTLLTLIKVYTFYVKIHKEHSCENQFFNKMCFVNVFYFMKSRQTLRQTPLWFCLSNETNVTIACTKFSKNIKMPQHQLYSSPNVSPNLNASSPSGMNTPSTNLPKKKKTNTKVEAPKNNTAVNSADDGMTIQEISSGDKSDSDSMNETDFFSKAHMKLPYSLQEDEFILKYVLRGSNIFKTSSLSLWKQLEYKKGNPKRTYQSLKNRFLRNIKPVIFTTHRHLIKDKETVTKILQKYPELKSKSEKKETLAVVKVPPRPLKPPVITSETCSPAIEENSVSSTSPNDISANDLPQEKNLGPVFEPAQIPISVRYIFGKANYRNKIECDKEDIRVTLDFRKKYKPKETPMIGVYQRFVQLKMKNSVARCEHCGRCDPESAALQDSDSDSDSDREGNLVIADSLDTPEKEISEKEQKEVREKSRSSSPTQPLRKKRKEGIPSGSGSPSLIDNVGETEAVKPGNKADEVKTKKPAKKKQAKSGSKEVKTKVDLKLKELDDFLSDKDLDSLYNETVANCRIFMDSDKEEEELNVFLKKSKNTLEFRPQVSLERANVEDFFLNSEPSSRSTPSKTSPTSKSKPFKGKDSPLVKNMSRMLKRGKKTC